jgi:hypothetical protein
MILHKRGKAVVPGCLPLAFFVLTRDSRYHNYDTDYLLITLMIVGNHNTP